MTDQSADLVTKIDVIPELEGLNSFDAAIERAIAKVNQLDAAIKRVNNLKPASPYAPTSHRQYAIGSNNGSRGYNSRYRRKSG
ncbi:Uncharacterised protein [Salmonella enterica subsp. arizonae]|uniref:Uncharacterized protein n=1 Tax=Salmonella enterica subsp. arizonae TaxID=59203 RepID=A0A379S4T3_SALER|nr:Uncharacterised protein [Salmonella enterica subsp. arizonae]